LTDEELRDLVRNAMRSESLVLLRECEAAPAKSVSQLIEQRRLIAMIGRKIGNRLIYAGRQYRLVADVDLDRLSDRNLFEVMGQDEARLVLVGLAGQSGAGERPELLRRASDMLTRDWRRPLFPDGLILLRRVKEVASFASVPEAPITPSQYARLLKTWIELEVLYDDGTPYDGPHFITLAEEKSSRGKLNKEGFWGLYEINADTYKFAIPQTEDEGTEAEPSDDEQEDEIDEARRVRLMGMIFDANKCFLLPQALPGIREIIAMHEEGKDDEVLIVGHAGSDEDLAGADIAYDRAAILGAYLTNKPNLWLNWFGPEKPARSRWGTREVQLMLSVLPETEEPFYEGYASGVTDENTRAAIKAFQRSTGLAPSGTADFETRKALVEAYMGLEDTTLGQDITPVAHGCEGDFDDTASAAGDIPDDRRIEVFFFRKAIAPRPDQQTSSGAGSPYPTWLAKVVETRDFANHGVHVQIVDGRKQPVPLATVRLSGPVNTDSVSDEHGFVSFFGLAPGNYTISSEKDGCEIGVSKLTYPAAKTVRGWAKDKAVA
jgi:peptidoglycan hydrolase-like protein with peptidoglycan-binding domain